MVKRQKAEGGHVDRSHVYCTLAPLIPESSSISFLPPSREQSGRWKVADMVGFAGGGEVACIKEPASDPSLCV